MPVYRFFSNCYFRNPRNQAVFYANAYMAPFSSEVWLCYAIILILMGLFMWFIFRVEKFQFKSYLMFLPSLLHTMILSLGVACSQSFYLNMRSEGGRFVVFILSLITYIIMNYYTSIVVSSLLASPTKSNIKTVMDLADSSLEIGFHNINYTKHYLMVLNITFTYTLLN